MPRKPQGLPYVRRKKNGALEYVRRVPLELRRQFGNRSYFTQVISDSGADHKDAGVIKRWSQVNDEVERLFTQASAQDSAVSTDALPAMPISPRNAAGIGAQPWKTLLNSMDEGQLPTDIAELLPVVLGYALDLGRHALDGGDLAPIEAGKADIARALLASTLNQLDMQPNAEAKALIEQRFWGYLRDFKADLEKRSDGDYSPGHLEAKAPPLPQKKVTYADLLKAWRLNSGGTREVDGIGPTSGAIVEYENVSAELIQIIGKHFPDEVTVADARQYVQHVQQLKRAPTTKQRRISAISHLLQIGVRYGYLKDNPFRDMTITIPKGGESEGYRPFTTDELRLIFDELKNIKGNQRVWFPLLLLSTGARLSEMMLLRHSDIKRTSGGVWYFDLVHEPTGEYPHPLKQGKANIRQIPMHPLLIERGFLSLVDAKREGYVFPNEKNDLISQWFKYVLKRLNIWEFRITALHSFRGTWIDLMREARVDEDIRRAFVGHSTGTSHDRNYGENLRRSPEILLEAVTKVDLSWLS